MHFKWSTFAVVFCLAIEFSAYARYCPESTQAKVRIDEIPIYELVPTQYGMGKDTVDDIYARFQQVGFVKAIRDRFSNSPLPVVLGPTKNGQSAYYVKDNHHIAIPVRFAYENGVISDVPNAAGDAETLICVAVDVDAREMSWDDFILSLYLGKFGVQLGFFKAEERFFESVIDKTSAEFKAKLSSAYESLFSNQLHELENVPVRSLVAKLFTSHKLQIRGRWFNEYIEFKLGEKFADASVTKLQVFKGLFGNTQINEYWQSELKKELSEIDRSQFQKAMEEGILFYNSKLKDSRLSEDEQLELLNLFLDS